MLSTEKTENQEAVDEAPVEATETKKPKKEEANAAAAAQSAELLQAAGKETGEAGAKSAAAGQSDEMIAAQQGQTHEKDAAEKAAVKEEASPAKGSAAGAKKAIVKKVQLQVLVRHQGCAGLVCPKYTPKNWHNAVERGLRAIRSHCTVESCCNRKRCGGSHRTPAKCKGGSWELQAYTAREHMMHMNHTKKTYWIVGVDP